LEKMANNGENLERPLDALNEARGKKVVVELKGGTTYVGILRTFDIHINVVLDDASELRDGAVKRKLGRVMVRGDNIIIISPES
jgi:small nuclear ribonucleoprotein